MKSNFILLIVILLLIGCVQNQPNNVQILKKTNEVEQTSYEFIYDKLITSFQGQSQIKQLPGKIILFKDEIHVFQGNKGEKFFIKDIQRNTYEIILNTVNNKNDKAQFKLYEKQNLAHIEVDLEGVKMNFPITSGKITDIRLFDHIKNDESTKGSEAEKERNQIEVDYCDCQEIHRDDGTNVTQYISLPVASDNSLEFSLAAATNNQDEFLTVAIRYFTTVKRINGDLSIRLKDDNMLTFKLINECLSYIGNNQLAQGVFALDNEKLKKLKSSELYTVSLKLDDDMVHTLECKSNTSILKEQLKCLTSNRGLKKYYNNKYKYEIVLPPDFKQEQATGKQIDLKLTKIDGTSILINVSPRTSSEYKITAHDYTKELLENSFRQYTPKIRITTTEKIYIDIYKAYLINYINPTNSTKVLEIYFYKDDYAFVLTATSKTYKFNENEKIFIDTFNSLKFK